MVDSWDDDDRNVYNTRNVCSGNAYAMPINDTESYMKQILKEDEYSTRLLWNEQEYVDYNYENLTFPDFGVPIGDCQDDPYNLFVSSKNVDNDNTVNENDEHANIVCEGEDNEDTIIPTGKIEFAYI